MTLVMGRGGVNRGMEEETSCQCTCEEQTTYELDQVCIIACYTRFIVLLYIHSTINREYFVVKIFSDSLACAKIKRTKIHAQY